MLDGVALNAWNTQNFYSILILSADSPIFNNLIANIYFSKVHDIIRVGKNHKIVPR